MYTRTNVDSLMMRSVTAITCFNTQILYTIRAMSLPQKVDPMATSKTLGISALQASAPVESRPFGISSLTTQLTAMQSEDKNSG